MSGYRAAARPSESPPSSVHLSPAYLDTVPAIETEYQLAFDVSILTSSIRIGYPGPMTAGVRERARLALRTEIAQAMSILFAERGFDAVTVEEAAGEVGISRATFFRYFGSKEDAVLA